jgi:SAM-dependent methyltransferase
MLRFFRRADQLEAESILHSMKEATTFAGGVMLDIGCGQKPYEYLFNGHVAHYFGVDIDLTNNKRLDVCADSLCLPVKSGSIDTVISNQTIEHVKDPETFFLELARVLRGGGRLILTAPQLWCLHEKPHDYYRFTRYALELLCTRHGLEVLLLRERYGWFAAVGQMIALKFYLESSSSRIRRNLVRPLYGCVQSLFYLLDRIFSNPDLTLGYILVAQKKGPT